MDSEVAPRTRARSARSTGNPLLASREDVPFRSSSASRSGGAVHSCIGILPPTLNQAEAGPISVIAMRPDGTIGVLYYDMRNDTADPATLLVDAWLTTSNDGVTWSERHVAGPFDFNQAPTAEGGLFIGDYVGLASAAGEFAAFFPQTSPDPANLTDIYASVFRGIAGPVVDKARITYRAIEGMAADVTSAWQQQLDRSAVKTLQRRRIGAAAPGTMPLP